MLIRSSALAPLLVGALLVAGCTATEPPPAPPTPTQTATLQAADPDAIFEEQAKRAESLPARRLVQIDWETAAAERNPSPALLPKDQARLDALRVPALLWSDDAFLASLQLVTGDGWYAASGDSQGLHVAIHAETQEIQRPDLVEELGKEADPTALRISESHRIYTVAFTRYGVHYTLDVECAQPGGDARCDNPEHALKIAGQLALMGGRP